MCFCVQANQGQRKVKPASGVLGCIGETPLVDIASLSNATGCCILAKAEMLNPGGSIKDRVALQIVEDAEAAGTLLPCSLLTEGTAGSTGVALAMVCAAKGYRHVPPPSRIVSGCVLEGGHAALWPPEHHLDSHHLPALMAALVHADATSSCQMTQQWRRARRS
jgi:hypothetical protein